MRTKKNTALIGPDIQRKINFLRITFSVGIGILLFFATKALLDRRIIVATMEYFVAASFILSLLHVHKTQKPALTSHYVVIVLALLFYYLTIKEGINHSCWGFVLPPFAMFLLGARRGIAFIAVYFIFLVMFGLDLFGLPFYRYSFAYMLRYAAAFFAITVISFFYEQTRSVFNHKIIALLDELSHKNSILSEIANRDSLTGLLNHKALHETLKRIFNEASRHHYPVSVLMMDIDKFKAINDRWGHPAGDEAIKKIALILKGKLRGYDVSMRFMEDQNEDTAHPVRQTAARYGGDEFVLILPHCGKTHVLKVANRILDQIRSSRIDMYPDIRIMASIGISVYDGHNGQTGPEQLIAEADQALYEAKEQGRNNIVVG